MPPAPLVDPADIDTSRVLADREEIGRHNPQRFEMVQLTAINYVDVENKVAVGYKDVKADEFWVRGHMPGYALMPGVLMCEAAAQLCSFYCGYIKLLKSGFVGFGGMEDVRFRGQVRPGRPAGSGLEGDAAPSPTAIIRVPGLRRWQHGLSRQDHRRQHPRTGWPGCAVLMTDDPLTVLL